MNNNPSHSEPFEELCAAYVLDSLPEDERQEFESMLEEADQNQKEIFYTFRATANQLAFSVDRAEPSDAVWQRIMEQINTNAAEATAVSPAPKEKEKSEGYSRYAMAIAASFALLLISLALIFYAFNLYADLSHKQDTIDQQNTQITRLKNEMQRKDEMLSILSARTVDMVVMAGLDKNPNGYGKVIWDSEKQQALLQVSNLPAIPSDKDYQLWLIKDNKPMPSGVFSVNRTGKNAFFKIEQMASASEQQASAFAVTLEPKGGSPQPTGDMYLMGNVHKNQN